MMNNTSILRESRKVHGKGSFGRLPLDENVLTGVTGSAGEVNYRCEYCGSSAVIFYPVAPGYTVTICLGCLRRIFS